MQHAWKLYQIINIFFVYIPLCQVLCNLKERPEIYPKTAVPSTHWPIKQTVHIRDLTIQTRVVSAIHSNGCSMFIRKPICSVHMANFLYDLRFLGPWMYGYATVSYNQILDRLKFWPAHTAVTTAKSVLGKQRWTDLSQAIMNSWYRRRLIFFDFSLTVKEAPHECVIRTGQP